MTGRCSDGHCITCSDEGVEMRVVRIDHTRGLALCSDSEGGRHTIETALVDAGEGDVILAHAGVAIARLEAIA